MRHVGPTLAILLLASLLASHPLQAEEAPAAPAAPADGAEGWDPDRFWFATVLPPEEAWAKVGADLRDVPRAEQRAVRKRRARAYVAAFAALGRSPGLDEYLPLSRFHLAAELYDQAADGLSNWLHAVGVTAEQQAQAAAGLGQLLVNPAARGTLGPERLDAIAGILDAYLAEGGDAREAASRATTRRYLAMYLDASDRAPEAIRQLMLMALEDPSRAAAAARTLMRTLQGATHDLESYPMVRAGAAAGLTVLQYVAARHLATIEADENADEGTVRRARASVELLAKAGLPIEMLGRPAPAWTLLEAYGDVTSLAELEGRVVVLDFWATWCPWCIKSFPAIRDLLRDYEEQGLVVVGVTAPASTVYAHRFDLDDDLESTGERPKPVARLARGEPDPDAEIPLLTEDEYRAVERETLPVFVANHAMTWPVVLVDAEDPGRKFALGGWPHAVVIDRAGRVRYFKSGALLRDRPEAVAAFRKVLEDLLAEPPPAADE